MPSRIIKIKRKPNPTNLPDDVYEGSKRKIGSMFTKAGSVYTGLSRAQEDEFMPEILGMDKNDPQFRIKVKDYFKNLDIDVKPEGIELEVGLTDAKKPENVQQYVHYIYIQGHPEVAPSKKELGGRAYKYFIEDPQAEKQIDVNRLKLKKEAGMEFIKITDNEKKMNMVIRLFFENPDNMDKDDKELFLEKMSEEHPKQFVENCTNKDLEHIAFIEECITKHVIRKVGNTIFYGDDIIGNDMEEAVTFFKNEKNSDVILQLKAKLQAYK